MGTNYYLHKGEQPCKCCGISTDRNPKHIGRSSYGWNFALHVLPEIDINTFADWIQLIGSNQYTIMDEYDEIISLDQLKEIVLNRGTDQWCPQTLPPIDRRSTYPIRYHPKYATLRQHIIDGDFCIAHGPDDATYDCIIGIFS